MDVGEEYIGELTLEGDGDNLQVVAGIRCITSFEGPPSGAITWWLKLCFRLLSMACSFVVSTSNTG